MHETLLVRNLVKMVEAIAVKQGAPKVIAVRVIVGILAPISPQALSDQFRHAAEGTVAERARLLVKVIHDPTDPRAQGVVLDSIDVEDVLPRTVRKDTSVEPDATEPVAPHRR